jgi:hypothetical protein
MYFWRFLATNNKYINVNAYATQWIDIWVYWQYFSHRISRSEVRRGIRIPRSNYTRSQKMVSILNLILFIFWGSIFPNGYYSAPWYQDYSEELPPWESDPDFTYPPFVFFIVCTNDKEFCIVLYIIDGRYLRLRIALNKVRKLTAI